MIMRIMKYGMLPALAAGVLAFAASSCTDASFPGLSDSPLIEGRPEEVTVLVGDYGRMNGTKGNGAVGDRWNWAERGADLKVFAFRRDVTDLSRFASDGGGACLIDGSLDTPGARSGRSATFLPPEYELRWTASEGRLYYPSGKVPYCFFAYGTGGLDVPEDDIRREAASISFPLKIDGAADLMYGWAEPTVSQLGLTPSLGLSEEELKVFGDLCFSDFTARHGIVPVLNFHHALSRISFDIYPGEEGCNSVIVDHISVTSKDSCVFTVASVDSTSSPLGADFSRDAKDAVLLLAEADGSALNDTLYHTSYYGDFREDVLDRPHVRVGGSFLLPQDSEYKFVVGTRKKGYDIAVESELTLRPKRSDIFRAGSHYVVRLVINDLIPVAFDVDYDDWDAGGDIDVGGN